LTKNKNIFLHAINLHSATHSLFHILIVKELASILPCPLRRRHLNGAGVLLSFYLSHTSTAATEVADLTQGERSMTSDETFAAAAHLYVLMRRKSGRAIDTVWAAQNREYAREVLRLARATADPEVDKLADRFETTMFGEADKRALTDVGDSSKSEKSTPAKYVTGVRC
jgi:hypothetical protein